MDINDIRSLATVACFIALMGVFWWACTPKNKKQFEEAAQLPFDNDEIEQFSKAKDKEPKR